MIRIGKLKDQVAISALTVKITKRERDKMSASIRSQTSWKMATITWQRKRE